MSAPLLLGIATSPLGLVFVSLLIVYCVFYADLFGIRREIRHRHMINRYKTLFIDGMIAWHSNPPDLDALLTCIGYMHKLEHLGYDEDELVKFGNEHDISRAIQKQNDLLRHEYNLLIEPPPIDQATLYELRSLVLKSRDRAELKGFRTGIIKLMWPRDWNTWVAELIELPVLNLFVRLSSYEEMPIGSFRALAAKALVEQDIVQAKIALAYCNYRADKYDYVRILSHGAERARTEMGTLAEQLQVMIKRLELSKQN